MSHSDSCSSTSLPFHCILRCGILLVAQTIGNYGRHTRGGLYATIIQKKEILSSHPDFLLSCEIAKNAIMISFWWFAGATGATENWLFNIRYLGKQFSEISCGLQKGDNSFLSEKNMIWCFMEHFQHSLPDSNSIFLLIYDYFFQHCIQNWNICS